ncbi:hypothetical protein BKA65DRAFT_601009 [Rhexocercosporidium sp. MPI-PUGE-AT-0058]|nr:hypothetical protein BKA65DRAFT_601009 [Rhexocercosporidium sp. MPI-PUGE-AT-0058]
MPLFGTHSVVIAIRETLHKTPEYKTQASTLDASGLSAYFKFLKDWRILVGVATVFLAQFRNKTIEILLPYTSVRFGLKLSQAATLLSVVSAVNIVVFLFVLPAASTVLQKRAGWSIHLINIYVARASSAFLVISAAVLAAAPNVGIVVAALNHLRYQLWCATVYLGRFDRVCQFQERDGSAKVWSGALGIGGRWIVLPFLVLMGVFSLAFLTSCFLTEPTKVGGEDTFNEQDPLLSVGDNENNFESLVFTE